MCKNIFILLVITLQFVFCSKAPNQLNDKKIPQRALTTAEGKTVESYNKFGIKAFLEINKGEQTKNIFISPLSISMALGMAINGAAESTYDSMLTTLELHRLTEQEINKSYKGLIELLTSLDPKIKFQIANSIWHRDGLPIEKAFIDTSTKYFNSEVKGLNFSDPNSGKIINNWVEQKTNGKIKEIVPILIPDDVVLYLINVIYFKGFWSSKFKKEDTRDDLFNTIDGSTKTCKMMYNRGDFRYLENEQFQAIDLLYGDSLFSMTIFLPREDLNINKFISQISYETWKAWMTEFRTMEGEIYLPKFKLEYKKNLNATLKTLGMGVAFAPYEANFSRIAKPENLSGKNLYITNVDHKTFIEVDEDGTEAAAVTSVEIGITSVPQTFVMRVDRPFVFVIRERSSGTILFVGKIVDV